MRGLSPLRRHRTATAEHLPKATRACEMAGLIRMGLTRAGKGFWAPEPAEKASPNQAQKHQGRDQAQRHHPGRVVEGGQPGGQGQDQGQGPGTWPAGPGPPAGPPRPAGPGRSWRHAGEARSAAHSRIASRAGMGGSGRPATPRAAAISTAASLAPRSASQRRRAQQGSAGRDAFVPAMAPVGAVHARH